MEKKITLARRGLLLLCLGMVAGSMVAHHGVSGFLAKGDPTQVTHPGLAPGGTQTEVKITTPAGTTYRYADFSQGMSLAEFLNEMGEDLFGKQAYAMGAPTAAENGKWKLENGKRPSFQFPVSSFKSRAPGQMAEPGSTGETLGLSVRRHRALVEKPQMRVPNMVHIVARHRDGTIFFDKTVHNLRTNAGINWQYGQMAGTTAAVCTYIALSNDSGAPAATDTAVASEITTNGLARANGTASHTANATSYTISYTFTATGSQSAQKAGLLNASSSGTLCFENTFTQVSMASGDTLAVTWTINF